LRSQFVRAKIYHHERFNLVAIMFANIVKILFYYIYFNRSDIFNEKESAVVYI